MTIIIDGSTKVVVQGITGGQGKFHTERMKEYGTNIVAGTTPGKGNTEVQGIRVYDSIWNIPEEVTASIIFVPAPFAKDAALEAIEFGLDPVVIITEHIPVHDSMEIVNKASKTGTVIIGPNTPGIITPGQSKMGVMPSHVFSPGNIGLISRSGTLTYEIVDDLTKAGLGQSTAVGLGGDPIVGLSYIDLLTRFESDPDTKGIVLIGEIGGSGEEEAAQFIKNNVTKPVVAYIAGKAAPKGKTMGHAGAIITGSSGTAESKISALEEASVEVAIRPIDIPRLMKKRLAE
jgi:succinyl-CoA synthetase alpha subunit